MIKKIILLTAFFVYLSQPVLAQTSQSVLLDLASDHVDITTGFSGAEVVVYGAISQPGDIAVTIKGPEGRMMVSKKHPVAGVWVGRSTLSFNDVPVYYDYASTKTLASVADPQLLKSLGVGLNALSFASDDAKNEEQRREYEEALIRTRQAGGTLPLDPKEITLIGPRFFKARFYLPSNVPTGSYTVSAFLFNNGDLTERQDVELKVAQIGFSALLLRFAYDYPIIYSFFGLFMAFSAGLAAFYMGRRSR